MASDAWDGRPQNPERTGPHELWNLPEHGGLGPTFWTWDADVQCWTLGFYMKHPEEAARAWRYGGPCHTPAEVAALVAADETTRLDLVRRLLPAGWVCVPKEPTEAMKQRGNAALSGWIAPAMHSADAYRAMCAAAQEGSS